MVLCVANNGSNSFQTATNTAYSKYPSGIFSFENYCGPTPDPAGNNAFLRIRDVAEGTSAETAYGSINGLRLSESWKAEGSARTPARAAPG